MRYRGYYYDTNTGLYYLQSRYYDPETGRFVNADTLIVAGNDYIQGTNMFAYCLNNPVMYVDPTGTAAAEKAGKEVGKLIIICFYSSYIAEYAKKNKLDINAFGDFLERTTNEDSSLGEIANNLEIAIGILNGTEWWIYSGKAGTFLDLLEISGKTLPPYIGEASNMAQLFISVMADIYNPLMFNEDIVHHLLPQILEIAGGMGITAYTAELTSAITLATGNPIFGFLAGTAFYFGANAIWSNVFD